MNGTQTGRDRLLEAAAAEFSLHGYSGASIADIAGRAGVSKSTIFHHFESKEALYVEVISQAAADFGQIMDQVLGDGREPAEALGKFQKAHLEHISRNREVSRLILRELQESSVEHKDSLVVRVLAANYQRLRRYLESARASGRIRESVDCEVVAMLLFSANVFYFQYGGVLDQLPDLNLSDDPDRFTRAVIDIVHNGLRAPNR